MKFRLPKRRLWRVMIYVASVLLILLAIDLLLVEIFRGITPSPQATRITGPKLPDGRLDYLTAVEEHFGRGVTPENNAAPLLLEALGREALPSNQPRDGITARLGMAPLPDQGDYFIPFDVYAKSHPSTAPSAPPAAPATANAAPATSPSDFLVQIFEQLDLPSDPHLDAQWLKANEIPLAKLTEASRRPRYFMPFNGGFRTETMLEILLPHLNRMRGISNALTARATLRLQAGDVDGAREDMMTVHRLARLVAQGATLIDRLVGYSIESRACDAEQLFATSRAFSLSADQARRWAREVAELPPISGYGETIDIGERYMYLDTMQYLSAKGPAYVAKAVGQITGPSGSGYSAGFFAWRFVPVNYEYAMQMGNHWYDGLMDIANQPSYPARVKAIRAWATDFRAWQGDSLINQIFTTKWPMLLFLPSLERMAHRVTETQARRELASVALALAAFKAEKGSYPKSLDELAPAYLARIPLDPFTEKPLPYSGAATTYSLSSVGPSADDPGAKPDRAQSLSVRVK